MTSKRNILFGMLILQLYVNAAPSDISKLEDIADVDEAKLKLDSEPYGIAQEAKTDGNATESARQKRFYNYYGYGFPPINPVIYPNTVKRDESSDTAVYGTDDPFVQIHKRLQEIIEFARQPAPIPVPTQVPIFFPVLYIPPVSCNCDADANNSNTERPSAERNSTVPDVNTRLPEMDDDRQNWGFIVNDSDTSDDGDDDFIRPISFEPIKPKKPLPRPPPPVEHNINQEDMKNEQSTEAAEGTQSIPALPPQSSLNELSNDSEPPSNCDGAILSCCHQPQVTFECFQSRGCPNPTSYGNPCDATIILQVIDKYQKYYGQRNG